LKSEKSYGGDPIVIDFSDSGILHQAFGKRLEERVVVKEI
jgi:hypothetical protein